MSDTSVQRVLTLEHSVLMVCTSASINRMLVERVIAFSMCSIAVAFGVQSAFVKFKRLGLQCREINDLAVKSTRFPRNE